jgi:Antitoxin component of bacterial toxin-antitoxin system, MqsA
MRMKCPMCAGAELSDDTQDVPYVDKGELTVLAGVTGSFARRAERWCWGRRSRRG